MAVLVHNLFEAKQRKYGTSGTAFTQDFIDAVNAVTHDVNERLGLTTTAIASTNDSISLDSIKYTVLYSTGIDFHMQDKGHWQIEDVATVESKYDRMLNKRWQVYQTEQDPVTRIGSVA